MIRRPPRSTQSRSSAASDVYKRQRASGKRRCIAGKRPQRSTRSTPRRTTTWRLRTSTKGCSRRRARHTTRPSNSTRRTCPSARTTISSRKSMTARAAAPLASVVAALALATCTSVFEIPLETPIQPKLDTSPFQRVLVAGFIAGGAEDVDANLETCLLYTSDAADDLLCVDLGG